MNSKYHKLLVELKSLTGKTLISYHSRGDVEAVSSALALRTLLPMATVRSPDRLSGHARSVLKRLGVKEPLVLKAGELASYDNVVLVDVASPAMLGVLEEEFNSFNGKRVVIDHHVSSAVFKKCKVFEFEDRTSCCEVVFDVLKLGQRRVDKKVASLLLCGVVVDSAFFESSNEGTFRAVASLLHIAGVSYSEVKRLVARQVDLNEIKTVLANLSGADLIDYKGEVVAFCSCKSFESSIATALIRSGASVALCFNEKSGEVSLVKSNASKVFGRLNAGRFLSSQVSKFKGESGGHELIAGARVPISKLVSFVRTFRSEIFVF